MRKFALLLLVGSLAGAQQTVPPTKTPYVDFSQGIKINGSFGTNSSCLLSNGAGSAWGSCASGGIPGLQSDGNNGIIVGGNAIFKGSTPRFDLDAFSAAGNGKRITGCSITSGTKIYTCTSAPFNCGTDVGKAIFVAGDGPSNGVNGSAQVDIIASCQSTSQVTGTNNAGQTANNQVGYFGTDDTTPLQNCVNAATAAGGECHINDAKMYMISNAASTIHVTGAAKGSGVASDGHGILIFAPYCGLQPCTLTPGNNDRLWNISSSITQYFGSTGGITKGATSFAVTTAPALTQGQWLQVAEVSYPGGYGYFDWARVASSVANDNLATGTYTSGITATGAAGTSCNFTTFNNGLGTATAVIYLTGTNAIASGTPFYVTAPGTGASGAPTSATATSGTATCSGTVTVATTLGTTINTTQPFRMAIPDSAPKWTGNLTLTQVARAGSLVTYTYSALTGQRPWPGSMITISGFVNAGNNGTLKVLSVSGGTSGTFTTVTNSPLQVNETHAGTGVDVDTQFGAGNQGQIYFAVGNNNLIDSFYLRRFKVVAPVLGAGKPMVFNFQAVLNPILQDTVIDAPSAQGLEWFLNKEGQLTGNRWNTYGEIPSSVDVNIQNNWFNAQPSELTSYGSTCAGHPTTTSLDMDLGLGFFTFKDNKISNWCNPAVAFYQGVHDGDIGGNTISWANPGLASAIGIVMIGGYNNRVTSNVLGGAQGASTTGIITEDSLLYGINSAQNLVRNNILATGGFVTRINCSGVLGTDAVYDIDDSGAEIQECGGGGQVGTITIGPGSGTAPLNGLSYRGNTTSGMQFVYGSNQAGASFTSSSGTQYSSGAVFMAHNAMQTASNTDNWTQPFASSRSTFLSVDALNGLRYCLNNSGQAAAIFAMFFPSCPLTLTPNGSTYLESQGSGSVNLNVRSGAGSGGVAGGDGSGSSTWTISGAGAASFASVAIGANTILPATLTGTQGNGVKLATATGTFTNGNMRSTNASGAEVDSGLPVNRTLSQMIGCGTTTTCANSIPVNPHIVYGQAQLTTGAATVTGISPAFTSTSSSNCTCSDLSSAAVSCNAATASTTSIALTGTGTDTVSYVCAGN